MSRRLTRVELALLAIVAAGAALRFATLDLQSFWLDEGITVGRLLRNDLGGMLSQIPGEQTPPLYYVLAWLWTRPFGTGEVAVRSLSALAGTATIPLAFALARQLVSRRAGLIAAALAAFNPLLVWYSQEGRSYALLLLLSGLSLLFFVRAIGWSREAEAGHAAAPRAAAPGGAAPRRRDLAAWALAAALALATHYFALFVVVPQATWLAWRGWPRRAAVAAVGAVGVAGLALLPLAIHQNDHGGAEFIGGLSLATRAVQVPKQYLVGYDAPAEVALTIAAAALAAVGVALALARGEHAERRGARMAAVFVVAAVVLPLVLSVVGSDYLITRNVISGWLPFAVLLAAGFGARRAGVAGPLAAAALCGIGLATVIAVDRRPDFQRDDWRAAARALGPAGDARAIVINPVNGSDVLAVYAGPMRSFPASGARVSAIDLVAVDRRRPGQSPHPARRNTPSVPDFGVAQRREAPTYTLVRLHAPHPVLLTRRVLYGLRLAQGLPDIALQTPPPPARR